MKKTIIAVGLPGVGKTTVIEEAKKNALADAVSLQIVNYGTVMMSLAKTVVNDRDRMRKSSLELQRDLQRKAAEIIMQDRQGDYLIVDTHLIVKTPSGYLPGIPSHVLSIIKPDLIALIEAPLEDIVERRFQDASRKRDSVASRDVELEIALSRSMAAACSTVTGVPLVLLNNEKGYAAVVGKRLYELMRS